MTSANVIFHHSVTATVTAFSSKKHRKNCKPIERKVFYVKKGIYGKSGRRLSGKTPCNTSAVQMEFCQIAFQPPHPQANGRRGEEGTGDHRKDGNRQSQHECERRVYIEISLIEIM